MSLIYLATPHTHPDENEVEERWRRACIAAARLISDGYQVYSPIAMTHPIHKFAKNHNVKRIARLHGKRPDFWYEFDKTMMDRCTHLVIVGMTGWDQSRGVAIEYSYFVEKELPWAFLSWMQVIQEGKVFLQWHRGDHIDKYRS